MQDKLRQAKNLAMLADLQAVLGANRKRAFGDKSEADDVGHIVLGDAYFGDEALKAKAAAAAPMPTTDPATPQVVATACDLVRTNPPSCWCWHTVILYVAVAGLAAAFLFWASGSPSTSTPTPDRPGSVTLTTE